MINVRVTNWRCIEKAEFELSNINVFIGGNSTGKSSLAYALYFASKSGVYDPELLLTQLYGYNFNMIARRVEDKPQFPISILVDGSELSVKPIEGRKKESFDIVRPSKSPWTDEYLLPSRRLDYFHIILFLRKMVRPEITDQMPAIFLVEFLKRVPILPPFGMFISDYLRGLTGIRVGPVSGKVPEVGSYIVHVLPYISLIDVVFEDAYVKLRLPADLAPDGLLDFITFDTMTEKIPQKSLVVIEEPEIHKNPLKVVEFTKNIVERALERRLTLIITTHSDIPLITMAKLVMKEELKAEDIKIYYFKRSKESPWTKISEIKIYSDGTLQSLPDSEELIAQLF
ncbi:MAG: AAA family ATPase [Acidilobaceae archaeon]